MKILFIDPKCPTPYDSEVLANRGLGGTEATVVRIASALAVNHDVSVAQHNRPVVRAESASLTFLPIADATARAADADHIVFIQKAQGIAQIAKLARGRLWLWLHNYLGEEVPFFWWDHLRHPLGIICVSRTHAEHTAKHVRQNPLHQLSAGLFPRGGIGYLHNPVDDALAADPQIRKDPHKLVFFSSPHKGLEQVVEAFKEVVARDQSFHLVVADPGYIRLLDAKLLDHPRITTVGTLSHGAVLQHVQEALCVFYPQYKRPETFGLVYAEANAVGVPVLAHDFGSAREVLVKENPPLDARNPSDVADMLMRWKREGTPEVQRNPDFTLSKVLSHWNEFLNAPDAFVRRQRVRPQS